MALLQKMDFDDSSHRKEKDYGYGNANRTTSSSLSNAYTLPTLDRLFRNFTDNHNRIEAIANSAFDSGEFAKSFPK
jgi:hypothetical protein